MSLGNQEDVVFLTVRKGKLCKNVPAGTPKALERVKDDSSIAYELRYNFIEGHILDLVKKETPWKDREGKDSTIKSWVLTMLDESWNTYKVEINYNSTYAKHLLNRIANIDYTEQVRILLGESPKEIDPTKMQGWLSVRQNREKIPPKYTKEEPGNLPQLESVVIDGKTLYDDSKMMLYYEKLVDYYKYQFQHPNGDYTYSKPEVQGSAVANDPEDDLPF